MIKVGEGKSYANILRKLQKDMKTDNSKATVISARATHKGDVLILLNKGFDKIGFTTEVIKVMKAVLRKVLRNK